jgi:hypothetical protein
MCTVIQITYTQKLCWTSNSMGLHSKNTSNNTYFVHCKQSKYYHTHMSYTTISYNFFQINLAECSQTCINNTYLTNCTNKWIEIRTSIRKEIKVKTLQSICTKFQQYPCLLNRPCCTSFYVCFWQPQMEWH